MHLPKAKGLVMELLSTAVGQRIPWDEESETKCAMYNIVFVTLLVVCLSFSAATLEKKQIPKG